MNLATTLLFYLLIGAALSAALWLRSERLGPGERLLRSTTALAFWPLYLPLVLQGTLPRSGLEVSGPVGPTPAPVGPLDGDLAQALTQVESELDLALGSLDGWSDAVLAREQDRFAELRAA